MADAEVVGADAVKEDAEIVVADAVAIDVIAADAEAAEEAEVVHGGGICSGCS